MLLKRFKIISPRDVQSVDNVYEILLLNLNHVISVKPIKIVVEDQVTDGFWIRTTNGKKYRAIEIPKELLDILNDESKSSNLLGVSNVDQVESQFLN